MSWLDRPVTWKWYIGLAIASAILTYINAVSRPRTGAIPPGVKP
jgi:hypothetical protein